MSGVIFKITIIIYNLLFLKMCTSTFYISIDLLFIKNLQLSHYIIIKRMGIGALLPQSETDLCHSLVL